MGDIVLDDDAIDAVNAQLLKGKWRVYRHGDVYTLIGPEGDRTQVNAADIDAVHELFLSSFLSDDTAPEDWEKK